MKILVVEDNQKLARFLRRALVEEGHVVDAVADGTTALEQLATLSYDLVILDWMLPDIDGLSVCRSLRSSGSRVPVLMLTARADVRERIIGLNAGADDYLGKPFDLGELLARVRALGRRSGSQTQEVGPLSLDPEARQASVGGEPLGLTPREYAVLAALVTAGGAPVSRSEFLSQIWGLHFDPGSNVVEVHIKRIRDKLGAHAGMVETVRGVGYRLDHRLSTPDPGADSAD